MGSVPALKDDLRIRNFRNADATQLRELYLLAMSTSRNAPRRIALNASIHTKGFYFAYTLILAGLAIASRSSKYRILGFILSIGVTSLLFLYRQLISNGYNKYNYQALEDLTDIAKHYKLQPINSASEDLIPSGPSGFWVAERAGAGIVGCIALDCTFKDGAILAEMHRMVVSPRYQRMGIGALLVRTLLAHARQHRISTIRLFTTEYQKPAINLYKKFGWIEACQHIIEEAAWLVKARVILFEYHLDLIYV